MNVRTLPPGLIWPFLVVSIIQRFFRRVPWKTLCAIGFSFFLSGTLHAEIAPGTEDLLNTIWVTVNSYSYVAVTTDGKTESFDGANFAIEFLEERHGVLVARVRWATWKSS